MSNHFHLLIKSEPESYYSDEQVKQRIEKYMDKDKDKKKKKKKKKKDKDKEEEEEREEVEVEEGEGGREKCLTKKNFFSSPGPGTTSFLMYLL
jgi:hypothetical protein